MPRYTVAYSGFLKRLREVEALNRLAKKHAVRIGPSKDAETVRALCRASTVLLSSHIEGYLEDLVEVILDKIFERRISKQKFAERFLYYFSKDLLGEVSETKEPDKIAEKIKTLFERDKDIWSTDNTFHSALPADRFISGFSNPSFEKIRSFIARFGYTNYGSDLANILKVKYLPCCNMIDYVIEQRNKIAHGDVNIESTPNDVTDMLQLVRQFCQTTDIVVGNWFRNVGCAIR